MSDGITITYAELLERVERAADQLRQSGACVAGTVPRIGLSCPNGLAYVIFALAIVRTGGCLVPIASELSPVERDALVLSTGLHSVVVLPGGEWEHSLPGRSIAIGRDAYGGDTIPGVQVQDVAIKEDARNGVATGDARNGVATGDARNRVPTLLVGLREGGAPPLAFDEARLSALNPAFIRFSSGTTGSSKGVVLSHESLLERVSAANRVLQIGPEDRVVWILPMAHHFAVSIMLYLRYGAATVIVNSHFPEDILAAALVHGGTVIYGAPFHHALLAAESSGRTWPGLRLAVSTAAPLQPSIARAFDARFGVPLSQALGMIEVGLPFLNVDDPHQKPESVGRPLPDFSVSVRDGMGRALPEGQSGELFVRGPGLFDAYLAPWRLRNEILEDGWFRTGDLASLDSEGFVRICGRAQTVINVAGMKCFPEEIEAVLCGHPAIREARVFAESHARFGSVPVAELVLRDPSKQPEIISVLKHCRASLAAFKIPVAFRFVESLPLTPSGKIRRAMG